MSYLVDSNVLSEATKRDPDPGVVAWLSRHENQVLVDPVILGEIRFGILLLRRGSRRSRLLRWFEEGVGRVRCLPWEASTGLRWAELLADLRRRGSSMPIKDSFIAATALEHGIAVVTRNVRDFKKAGVEVLNPFSADPPPTS